MALSAQGLAQSINTSDTLTEHSLIATFYHDRFEGRKTSCGEIFDQNLFTAAHKSLKIGTMLMVTNPKDGRQVIVRVNDRCPKRGVLDLTRRAAYAVGVKGRLSVNVRVLPDGYQEQWLAQDRQFDSVKTTLRDKKNNYGYGESSDNSRYNLRIATVASHSDAFDIIQKLPEELQDKVLVDIISDTVDINLILEVHLDRNRAKELNRALKHTFPESEIIPSK